MDKIRVQPSSSEAEKALLGSVLLGGTKIFEKAKSWVRASDTFYSNINQQLWKSIQSLYRNKEEIDTITVLERFKRLNPKHEDKDGLAYYITGLSDDIPTTAHVVAVEYVKTLGTVTYIDVTLSGEVIARLTLGESIVIPWHVGEVVGSIGLTPSHAYSAGVTEATVNVMLAGV